jgi:arabinofuranosyltransferase
VSPPAEHAVPDPESVPRLIRLALFVLFLVVVLRHAWVTDDAYITFRTIDNFVHGDGLGWNVDERVQSYTHPLWMFLMSVPYFVTREAFYTSIVVSLLLSGAAVWLAAWRHARTAAHGALAIAALLGCLAFVDYSTSGLENPLTHLLLGLYFLVYVDQDRGPRSLLRLSLLAGAVTLNRMDLFLVVLPALAEAVLAARSWRNLRLLAIGFLPLIAWELFSLLYYGFLFPNTAYAKLGSGIPAGEMMGQGMLYFVSTLDQDPMTIWMLVLGLVVPALARRRRELAVAAGVLLYLLYLVRIGGDFMLGRFLSAPLYVAALLLARVPWLPGGAASLAPAGLVLVVSTLIQFPTLRADATYPRQRERGEWKDPRGVADERAFYHDTNGLLSATRQGRLPERASMAQDGFTARRWPQKTALFWATGMAGYFSGRGKHVIDQYALTDPLMARLPAVRDGGWRTGHFRRHVPEGYLETLETGENHLVDPELRRYYEDLRRVVRGPIFSGARFAAMWRLATGADDALIATSRYRAPGVKDLPFARFRLAAGAPTPAPEPVGTAPSSIWVRLEGMQKLPVVGVRLEADDTYRVAFNHRDQECGAVIIPGRPGARGMGGLQLDPDRRGGWRRRLFGGRHPPRRPAAYFRVTSTRRTSPSKAAAGR